MKILIQCESCEASFCVQHDLGERFYTLSYCAFCGEPIEHSYTDEMCDEEDEDESW
jgi:hypothetical protein